MMRKSIRKVVVDLLSKEGPLLWCNLLDNVCRTFVYHNRRSMESELVFMLMDRIIINVSDDGMVCVRNSRCSHCRQRFVCFTNF